MDTLSPVRLFAVVLLPFGAVYFLSYAFRNINALIATELVSELDIGPTELGLLTSVLFFAMASVQIPLGVALDHYGPRRVQATLLVVSAGGAIAYASADDFFGLLFGRALIGVGVATSLMAGLKAIVLWTRPERIACANGILIMTGALGAIAVTAPAETLLTVLGWRGLLLVAAALSILAGLIILAVAPESPTPAHARGRTPNFKLRHIYADRRFQRIAPISMFGLGASWSLQGLWAAPWLEHVAGFDRPTVVAHLLAMAIALAVGALGLGWIADRLTSRGIGRETVLASVAAANLVAQLALVAGVPVPPIVPWMVIAAAGAATTISFAILPGYFPKAMSARANGALNLLHLLAAFGLQCAIGAIIDLWPAVDDHPPATAYQAALGSITCLQGMALAWFAFAANRSSEFVLGIHQSSLRRPQSTPAINLQNAYDRALTRYAERVRSARFQAIYWRRTAMASAALCAILVVAAAAMLQQRAIPHVIVTDSIAPDVATLVEQLARSIEGFLYSRTGPEATAHPPGTRSHPRGAR